MAKEVITRGIRSFIISHYCPYCNNEVYSSNTTNNIKNCEHCGNLILFPDEDKIRSYLE